MAEAGNSPRETRGQAIPPFWAETFWGGGNEFLTVFETSQIPEFGFDLGEYKSTG